MTRFLIPVIIFLHLFNNSVFAQDSVLLDVNQPAPFKGFLLSREKVDEFRNYKLDLDLTTKSLDITNKQNELLNVQLDKANLHINKLSDQVVKERNDFFSNVAFFLLGAACTTLITFSISKVVK